MLLADLWPPLKSAWASVGKLQRKAIYILWITIFFASARLICGLLGWGALGAVFTVLLLGINTYTLFFSSYLFKRTDRLMSKWNRVKLSHQTDSLRRKADALDAALDELSGVLTMASGFDLTHPPTALQIKATIAPAQANVIRLCYLNRVELSQLRQLRKKLGLKVGAIGFWGRLRKIFRRTRRN